VSVAVALLLGWRAWLAWRDRRLPPRWLLIVLAILTTVGVIATYIPFLRRDASVALLALMMALKCLELRTLRDATVAICLGYFLIITNFLYSQTIPYSAFMAVVTGLAHRHHGGLQDSQRHALSAVRTAGRLDGGKGAADAGLFRSFHASRAGVRLCSGQERSITGLSDNMSPGDSPTRPVRRGGSSRIHTPPRAPSQMYWRGPVLGIPDGRTWTMGSAARDVGAPAGTSGSIQHGNARVPPHALAVRHRPPRPRAGRELTSDYQLLERAPVRCANATRCSRGSPSRIEGGRAPAALRRALRLPG
jgi:hypothetical protein